jgi:hypothetical protein
LSQDIRFRPILQTWGGGQCYNFEKLEKYNEKIGAFDLKYFEETRQFLLPKIDPMLLN